MSLPRTLELAYVFNAGAIRGAVNMSQLRHGPTASDPSFATAFFPVPPGSTTNESLKVFIDNGVGHTRGRDGAPQRTFHYVGFPGSCEGHVSKGGDIFRPQDRALLKDDRVLLDGYHLITEHPDDHEGHQVRGHAL
jgi:hypothetical protein